MNLNRTAALAAVLTAHFAAAAPSAAKKAECAFEAEIAYDASYAYQVEEPLSHAVERIARKYTASEKGAEMTAAEKERVADHIRFFVSAVYTEAQAFEQKHGRSIKGVTEEERKINARSASDGARKGCLDG
ncbi:MAG: hypothetical protein Q3966_07435 [Neisseria sp.]|nr:hypothetical protein [Neisseria sp.]